LSISELPDWWDEKRAEAGKDRSTCAAELRLALDHEAALLDVARARIQELEKRTEGVAVFDWIINVAAWTVAHALVALANATLILVPARACIAGKSGRVMRLNIKSDGGIRFVTASLRMEDGRRVERTASTAFVNDEGIWEWRG
jgi:hypothetical protein